MAARSPTLEVEEETVCARARPVGEDAELDAWGMKGGTWRATHCGIRGTAYAGAIVDAAKCCCVACASPVFQTVDGLVAHIPNTKVL